jgi:hypothetical protein
MRAGMVGIIAFTYMSGEITTRSSTHAPKMSQNVTLNKTFFVTQGHGRMNYKDTEP